MVALPEQLFYEAAFLLDDVLEQPDSTASQLSRRWTEIVTAHRKIAPTATPMELYLSTAAVFLVVAVALSLHRKTLYNQLLHDTLLDVVEKKKQQQVQDKTTLPVAEAECHHVVCDLSADSQPLDEWINDYIDTPGEWLSDVVQRVAGGGPYQLTVKLSSKPKTVRQPQNPETIEDSFTYCAQGIEDKALRLQLFCQCLLGRYIDKDTDQQQFIDMFLGKNTTYKVTWIGNIKELKYLFEKLFDHLVTHKHTKWTAVCARFNYRAKISVPDPDTTKKEYRFQIEKLTSQNFNTQPPEKHDALDRIIKILLPQTQPRKALDDFNKYWEEQTKNDEEKDDNFATVNGLRNSSHPW